MQDIMIDLETLSTAPDAAILSIGACVFDLETGEINHPLHLHIDIAKEHPHGHISPETVEWWFKQDKAAQTPHTLPNRHPLSFALRELADYINQSESLIWANGASFDLTILRSAYARADMPLPWQYWQERDTRTLNDIAERLTGYDFQKNALRTGTHHDALDDAIHQAKYLARGYQSITQLISKSIWHSPAA